MLSFYKLRRGKASLSLVLRFSGYATHRRSYMGILGKPLKLSRISSHGRSVSCPPPTKAFEPISDIAMSGVATKNSSTESARRAHIASLYRMGLEFEVGQGRSQKEHSRHRAKTSRWQETRRRPKKHMISGPGKGERDSKIKQPELRMGVQGGRREGIPRRRNRK